MNSLIIPTGYDHGQRTKDLNQGLPGTKLIQLVVTGALKGKGKGTLFNVGSSFSYETDINGIQWCALHPFSLRQCSVLRVFKAIATRMRGKLKQTLKSLSIGPGTSSSESCTLTNCATPTPKLNSQIAKFQVQDPNNLATLSLVYLLRSICD